MLSPSTALRTGGVEAGLRRVAALVLLTEPGSASRIDPGLGLHRMLSSAPSPFFLTEHGFPQKGVQPRLPAHATYHVRRPGGRPPSAWEVSSERGAGACVVEDFPAAGQTMTLEWQQNSQNFGIVAHEAAGAEP